jgi:hypothetical protein
LVPSCGIRVKVASVSVSPISMNVKKVEREVAEELRNHNLEVSYV